MTERPPASVSSRSTFAWVISFTFVVRRERGAHAAHVGVGLAVGQAGEAVEPVAAHAAAGLGIRLVEVDADRQVERMVAGPLEVVGELLDPRLVRHRRIRERPGAPRLGRILAGLAVDQVQPLGLGVVGLEVVVGDRPRRRDAAVVADLARSRARAAGTGSRRRTSCCRRRSTAGGACRRCRPCRTRARRRGSAPCGTPRGCPSSRARAGGSRRARAAGSSCRSAPACGRACRRPRRCR